MPTTAIAPFDLIVVGGGILGFFHAYHAVQRGKRTLLIDRDREPRSATVRNFGQVVPSGLNREWQRYGRDSLAIYRDLQSQGDLSIRNLGSLYLASNEDELMLLEELSAINREDDYRSELWTVNQCLQRMPNLRRSYCRGGLFFPEEVSVNPRELIHRLHQRLQANAMYQCQFQTLATRIEVTGDAAIVNCSGGQKFQSETVIVCNGSDFQHLYPELFQSSSLEQVKLQMVRLEAQPQVTLPGNLLTGLTIRRYESFAECPSWQKVKSREEQDTFAKRWGIHILFKQEVDGSIILGDSHEYIDANSGREFDYELRQDINEYFISAGQQILELPSWQIAATWFGVYAQTSDPSGVFQKVVDGRVHIVTGIGGKGMTSSAGFAKQHIDSIFN